MVASRWGEGPLVKALLLRKADVLAQDMHGNSSLAFAAQYGHLNIVTMLLGVKNGGREMV
jgi:ankyrin repeat protein